MIGRTVSHYKIVDKLGQGGMGHVFKAEDTRLGRIVALKFLPPHITATEGDRQRFLQEARAASTLDHPNICTIYEINETPEKQTYIAMAYYEGETLKEKIARGPFDIEEAVWVAIEIGSGLQTAHEYDITHRDIKPANIMITRGGDVKIIDFGVAKLARGTGLTKTGSTVGTVAYMSPEQARGDRVDHQTDIWALGVILYEMLTGQRPFAGEFEQAVVYFIVNEDPKTASRVREVVPPELDAILKKALNKNRAERYQTMTDFVGALREFATTGSTGETDTVALDTSSVVKKVGSPIVPIVIVSVILATVIAAYVLGPWGGKVAATDPPAVVTVQEEVSDAGETSPSGETSGEITPPDPEPVVQSTVASQTEVAKQPQASPPAPDYAAEADIAMTEMARAREAAVSAGAATHATDLYAAAEATSMRARGLFEQQEWGAAKTTMREATRQYSDARVAAVAGDSAARAALGAARERAETARRECPADATDLSSYTNALALEESGKEREAAGDLEAATAGFGDASRAYQAVTAYHAGAVSGVESLIESYRRALETEDIHLMSALFDGIPADQRSGWENFFSAVSDLRVTTAVNEISVDDNGATADLDADLSYHGAGSGNTAHRWQMRFVEKADRWMIREVAQDNR